MIRYRYLAAAACVALAGGAALAQERPVASLGITGGTLGVGPEAGYRFSNTFGVRANATFLGLSHGFDSDDIAYDGKLKLRSAGAMVDVYPFGGGFRLSGGLRINGNRARVTATPTQPTEIGDIVYSPAQIGTLTGRARVKDVAPALTLGYGGSMRSGFMFGIEAGALFQGTVRIQNFTATGNLANNAAFLQQLEEERRELQDDVNDYKVYPILQLSIGYRF